MRPDGDLGSGDGFKRAQGLLRHSQLGRSTAPEQVAGGGRDDSHLRGKIRHPIRERASCRCFRRVRRRSRPLWPARVSRALA